MLRRAGADRRDGLLLGPRLHRRSATLATSTRPARADRGGAAARRLTSSSSRAGTRTHCSCSGRSRSRASARRCARWRGWGIRSTTTSSCGCARARSCSARRICGGSATGPPTAASSTISRCPSGQCPRTFPPPSGSRALDVVRVEARQLEHVVVRSARRGSVVKASAQPASASSRRVVASRLPYG